MANHLRNVLLGLLLVAGLAAQQAKQTQQDSSPRDDSSPALVTPPGYHQDAWVPVVVLWWTGDPQPRAEVSAAFAAKGFVVVPLDSALDAPTLRKAMASVRQRVRIAQGGMHALIATDPQQSIAALLSQRHEFQTVTLCGAAAGADPQALRRLPKRRVQSLPTSDATQLCDSVFALHQQRQVAGKAKLVSLCLDSFHDAAAVADEQRYFAILPDDAIFLGTDATERWTGKQFREFAMRYFKQASAWTYVPLERHVTMSPDGKLAWFDEALENAGYGECRGSGVLQERDGHWVLLQYNLTVPVPNELMGGVAKRIRAHLDGDTERGK